MPSSNDRRAATALLCVALVGAGVRYLGQGSIAPGAVGYRAGGEHRPNIDSVGGRAERLSRPLGANERIDVDRATAEELLRLPRIGPALATRIVENRTVDGPFASLEGLERVSGIGPSTIRGLARHVTFSGRSAAAMVDRRRSINLNRASREELAGLPGIGPVRAAAIIAYRELHGPFERVEELLGVPGIGPRTVEQVRTRLQVS
jgi:competence protein ComEA